MNFSKLAHQFLVEDHDKDQARSYYESQSHNYNEQVSRGLFSLLRKRERNAVLHYAQLKKHSEHSLIDVGCGDGFYALEAKKYGLTVSAVDFSSQMIQKINGKVDEAWVDDIETLQLPKTFNIVICSGVLDFVLNPQQAFSNLAQLVSPQGRLIIQVPRTGHWSFIYGFEKWFFGLKVNFYSIPWFLKQAQTHGLQLIDYHYPLPHNVVILFERK